MIYLVWVFFSLVFALYFDVSGRGDNRQRNFFYKSLFLVLIVLMAIKRNIGGDAMTFILQYENDVPSLQNEVSFIVYYLELMTVLGYMPLWSVLNIFCKTISEDFFLFQTVHALIVNSIAFYFFRKKCKYPFVCVFIYSLYVLLYFNVEIMRESLAAAIGCIAFGYLIDKKYTKYFLFVFLAMMFHISASIMFVFPFVDIKYNKEKALLFFVISVGLFLTSNLIASYLHTFVIADEGNAEKVGFYLNRTVTIFGFLFQQIKYYFFPSIIAFQLFRLKGFKNEYTNRIMGIYFFLMIFCIAMPGFGRFKSYFFLFYIIYFSIYLVEILKGYFRRMSIVSVLVSVLVFCNIISYYFEYYPYSCRYRYEFYIPYTTCFDDEYTVFREDMHRETQEGGTKANFRKQL